MSISFKGFTLDNKAVDLEIRDIRIMDFYGLQFKGKETFEDLVVLAARLTGKKKAQIEAMQYSSVMGLVEMISEMISGEGGPNLSLAPDSKVTNIYKKDSPDDKEES